MKNPGTNIKKGQHLNPAGEFKKGIYPGNGFEKGDIPWNKGLHYTHAGLREAYE